MRKTIVCVLMALITLTPNNKIFADEVVPAAANAGNEISRQVAAVYDALSAGEGTKPSFEVFEKAYRGYLNLVDAGKINVNKQVLTICDLSLSSCANRMWVIDLHQRKVLLNTYVAHGQGSGDEFAQAFSNTNNSHQSSLGFYVTGSTYSGEHGRSLYLHGMDRGYNDLAYERSIVVHGADYVSKNFIAANKRLGRSWGCPAVSDKLSDKVIDMVKDGTCLFVFYPNAKYLQSSVWINKTLKQLPKGIQDDWQPIAMNGKAKPTIVYDFGPTGKFVYEAVRKIEFPLY